MCEGFDRFDRRIKVRFNKKKIKIRIIALKLLKL